MSVVLFSGHMVDAPGRATPRFPPERVPEVRRGIEEAVTTLVPEATLAISGVACGGDLIFCEAWLAAERPLHAFLPRPEEEFLDESVRFAGDEWEDAYRRVTTHPATTVIGPDAEMLGLENPHTLNNERMLARAIESGQEINGVFLWDGKGGDGPGGTGHLVSEVLRSGGSVSVLRP
jgi:hypothetical protein